MLGPEMIGLSVGAFVAHKRLGGPKLSASGNWELESKQSHEVPKQSDQN